MKINFKQLKKRRKYSDDFKKEIVRLFESGEFSVYQLEKIYGVGNPTIYSWIYKFSTFNEKSYRVVEMKESSNKKMQELEAKVKELEQIVGRKQITIDYLNKMMDVAKEEYDIDIKKNFDTLPSTGLEKTKKK
jgi:transposase